jgi:hypothetical protein
VEGTSGHSPQVRGFMKSGMALFLVLLFVLSACPAKIPVKILPALTIFEEDKEFCEIANVIFLNKEGEIEHTASGDSVGKKSVDILFSQLKPPIFREEGIKKIRKTRAECTSLNSDQYFSEREYDYNFDKGFVLKISDFRKL